MLKRFFMNMLSSFVGAWLAIVLIIMSGFILIMGMVGSVAMSAGGTGEELKSKSILRINLNGEIQEVDAEGKPDLMSLMQGDLEKPQALNVIVAAIREAANNKNISAIYLECGVPAASPATLNAIRDEIVKFRKSGKQVYAYGDNMSMGSYYVASAADRVYLNPQGILEIQGMSATSLYMKDLFDKLGVEFQVVKVGTFKSAVEPYIMQTMSEPARAQMDTLLTNMWGIIKQGISKSRKGVTPQLIDSLVSARNITFQPATLAMQSGLVDSLAYGRTMNEKFARITGQEAKDVNYVGPMTLVNQVPWGIGYSAKNQIAVLYAVGEIADGNPSQIDYQTLVPVIEKLAEDDHVKGMVLRVNSPGGSAFGSAQIGEALDHFMSKGKPLAVSMGDYAASGGYWISSGANIIFADPLTITGSIGIFGLIPNLNGLAGKVGVNPQTVSTNPGANFPNMLQPMDERQTAVMQRYVERGYEEFVNRVAKGRKMTPQAVKRIAEGRVWDALSAKRIGLVDSLGGLKSAIEWTARKADIYNKYEISVYPEREPSIWDLLPGGANMKALAEKAMQDPRYERLVMEYVRQVIAREKIQARMQTLKVDFKQ